VAREFVAENVEEFKETGWDVVWPREIGSEGEAARRRRSKGAEMG